MPGHGQDKKKNKTAAKQTRNQQRKQEYAGLATGRSSSSSVSEVSGQREPSPALREAISAGCRREMQRRTPRQERPERDARPDPADEHLAMMQRTRGNRPVEIVSQRQDKGVRWVALDSRDQYYLDQRAGNRAGWDALPSETQRLIAVQLGIKLMMEGLDS